MKKRKMDLYIGKCSKCGNEMLNGNKKEQMCWRCREKLRREFKRGNVWEKK